MCPSDHPGQAHPPGGRAGVEELNQALVARAAEHKLLRTHRVRVDTTVVAAKVAYRTDLGLLARAVDKLATTARGVQAAGVRPAP
jgi:transposase, IS5 family